MYEKFIVLICTSLILIINAQNEDLSNIPMARFMTGRTSAQSFDTQFSTGRCPRRFYQLSNECVYFAIDGKSYSWRQVDRVCSQRIANLLEEPSASNLEQPNMQPTRGVRQLTLNTPEKTEILRALFRDYSDQNFAVQLPDDYTTLARCRDGQDDRWPQFCANSQYNKSGCYETVSANTNDICLRQVDCRARYLRVACEFTLPGSPEITTSQFRTCPVARSRFRRLPNWAWILIVIASGLVLLGILAALIGILRKKRRNGSAKNRSMPVPRPLPPKHDDPVTRPILVNNRPAEDPDTGYLSPTAQDNTANA